jgi:NADPH:quinone reductase-like Zn-dependent oxidoreductase
MRAVIYERYGPPEVLQLVEVERPTSEDDQVLVRVHAATVSRGDAGWRGARFHVTRVFSGIRRPKEQRIGQDFAGEVVEVGKDVTSFAVGDRVFGVLAYFGHGSGTYADYVAVPETAPIAAIPDALDFDEAAAIPDGAMQAMNVLAPANLQPGQRLLVYGATGSIGTAALQLAKAQGAHVTAVADTARVELVRSLGADVVLDYTRGEDFRQADERFDAVCDTVGILSFPAVRRSLAPHGVFLPTDGLENALWWLWGKRFGRRKVSFELPPRFSKEYLLHFKELVERGAYRPVIDRHYRLEEVVDATRYVEQKQKTGNVILTIAEGRD